jgi:hypothetical protein
MQFTVSEPEAARSAAKIALERKSMLTKPARSLDVRLRVHPGEGVHHEVLDLTIRGPRSRRDTDLGNPKVDVKGVVHFCDKSFEVAQGVPRAVPNGTLNATPRRVKDGIERTNGYT